MTFVEVRNKLIAHLWEYLGCPVVLSNQVQPEAEIPFGIYTVTAPYVPDGGLGDITEKEVEGGMEVTRMEMPSATFSFTFCSQDRTGPEGNPISGADEAETLVSRAAGYFLHAGYDDFLRLGIAVVEVGQTQDRTVLLVDEAARRVGFDVRIRYTRQDTRLVSTVEETRIIQNQKRSERA